MPLSQLRTWARTIIRGRDVRRRPRRTGRPRLEWLEERATPAAVSWTGAGDGINWSDVHNWSTATRLPGPADDVTISAPGTFIFHTFGNDSVHSLQSKSAILLSGGSLSLAAASAIDNTLLLTGATLTAAGPLSINALEQTGGTLSGAGTVTIQGLWDWSGGTQGGTGHTDLLGTATLSSGNFSIPQLSGRAVDNDGTATLTTGSTLNVVAGGAWNNQSDGTFVLPGGSTVSGGPFNNAGLLQLTGPQSATISGAFNNTATGTVDVQAGGLSLGGGGSGGGTFDLEDTSTLSFGGNYNLQDGAAITGTGTVTVGSFTGLNVSGSVSVTSLTVSGGTLTLNAGANLDAQGLKIDGSFSTLAGAGNVTVENDFVWNSGHLNGSGDTTLNGTSEISGDFFAELNGRTVDNHGVATLAAGTGFDFFFGGNWNNHADGTLVLQSGSSVGTFIADSSVLTNDGLVQMVGPGSASVNSQLRNNAGGTVDVEGGVLSLKTGSSAGNFNVAAGAVLNFNDSFAPSFELQNGATATGAGAVQVDLFNTLTVSGGVSLQGLIIDGGTVTVNGGASLTAGNLTLAGGALTGGGDVTVAGPFLWSNGTLGGTGQATLQGDSTLSGGFFSPLNGRTVFNDGSATVVAASGISFQGNAVWNNQPDGSLTLLAGSSLSQLNSTGSRFNNAGLLVAGPNSSIGVAVNNSGTVLVPTGAALSVGGAYTQTGGATTVDGTLTASNTVFLNGGFLNGGGTINGNVVNAAELEPGDSPGALTINGNYTQTSAGVLDIEIGGPAAGQFDRLVVNGTASLAGTLNVVILNGFVPDPGTSFGVLTFRSHTGDFDVENGLDLGGGLSLVPSFNAGDTGLSLAATQSG
jgi:hypothetical protein